MKILDYGIHMNEKLEPVMVFTIEVPMTFDFTYISDEVRFELERFLREEQEKKK
jgi:hypothetical protein